MALATSPPSPKGTPAQYVGTHQDRYAPWVRATTVEDTCILWLPVQGFPMRWEEKRWILAFLRRFATLAEARLKVRQEVFLHYATATSPECLDRFRAYVQRCQILLGLSRGPGEAMTGLPEMHKVEAELKEGKGIDLAKWSSDYALWFQNKGAPEQEQLFLGEGGLCSIFLPADPATTPPPLPFTPKLRAALPVFQRFDVDATLSGVMALNDKFLPASKEMFGKGIEFDPDTVGFVLPRFDSGHLIWASAEERATWFQLFDIYLRESPKDNGMLLAFRKDLSGPLLEALHGLDEDGLLYPTMDKDDGRHA